MSVYRLTPEQMRAHQARIAKSKGGEQAAGLDNLDWRPMGAPKPAPRCGNCGSVEGRPHLADCVFAQSAPSTPSPTFREAFGKAKEVVAEYMAGGRARKFVLSLPVPPSVNMNTYPTASGGRVLTDAHRGFRSVVAATVFNAKLPRLYGRLSVRIHVNAPRVDIDNIVKPTLDALQRAGAIENDRNVDDLHVVRSQSLPLGMLEIEVGEL